MELQKESDQAIDTADAARDWAIRLFEKSVLKQQKFRELQSKLPPLDGSSCLDLGSDNGVISLLLRRKGGTWWSGDLSEHTVESIRSLVGERVFLTDGLTFPIEDAALDVVVVVDMLEHVERDDLLMSELARVLKPGGVLLVNAPNVKPYSPLRWFRHLIGQTDEAHGHLRPGYSQEMIQALSHDFFTLEHSHSYSRFFTELIDTVIVAAYTVLSGNAESSSSSEVSKGLVVTEDGLRKLEKKFAAYSKIYPLFRAFAALDTLIPFVPGFMRLSVLKRNE